MARSNNKDSKELRDKQGIFSKILDDLTTLEINTIIKKGMSATPPPERIEETVQGLLFKYKKRIIRIIYKNSSEVPVELAFDFDDDFSIKAFHEHLEFYKRKVDKLGCEGIRLPDTEYTRIIRMLAFCDFIKSRSDKEGTEIKLRGEHEGKTLYEVDLEEIKGLRITIDTRDTVKINRFYDLGDETVVMQTRFGIDGDIVTRIEEEFSNRPKKLITEIHDEHTNLSVKYWQSLINIAKGIIIGDK